jgi:hypothetical protein
MKSPPSSSTASAIYTTIAHMRHAVATRFLDLPRQFIPWRREVLTPDGKLSTVDAFMLSPFFANLTPACERRVSSLMPACASS